MNPSRRNLLLGHISREATAPRRPLAAADPLLHLLNRITWGARPEELARAREMGYAATLEEQLHPEQIDDSAAEERLRRYALLNLDRRGVYSLVEAESRAYIALARSMLDRAVHSRRQLLERMVEFWSDHFNIPGDGEFGLELVAFQRDVIRQHALGRFRDLLMATARAPAMLLYLDNFVNEKEAPNENYARELMELHTLGVDGGYTEQDVKEVARAFTGWTIHPHTRRGFYFDGETHDRGPKRILGHSFPAGRGIEDGLHVLSILAHHPSTARHICHKLCVRFVSDDPPTDLVEELADVWQAHDGAMLPVLRHLFLSDAFKAAAGQKLRRPLDFFVGALRATGTEVHETWVLEELLTPLGQLPFGWHPPNGYPDVAPAWLSTGGLLARWNVAMRLTHGAYSDPEQGYGLTTGLRQRIGEPATVGELVDAVAVQVFAVPLPGEERASFVDYASDGEGPAARVTPHLLARKLGSLYGLMLASPLYQWR